MHHWSVFRTITSHLNAVLRSGILSCLSEIIGVFVAVLFMKCCFWEKVMFPNFPKVSLSQKWLETKFVYLLIMDVERVPPAHSVLTDALYELRCHTKLSCFATEHRLWQTANFSTKLENRHFDTWIFSLLPSFLRPGGRHWEGNLVLEGVSLGL